MFEQPFSFSGRIRRMEYGISMIIYTFIYIFIGAFAEGAGEEGAIVMFIFFIPLLWFIWAQGAKRCHDLDRSGWWQLIPFYGLWMLFQDGKAGPNQYGENPKELNHVHGNNMPNGNPGPVPPPVTNTTGSYSGGYDGGHNNHQNSTPSPQSGNYTSKNGGGYKSGDLYN